jgi:hypothetical protein
MIILLWKIAQGYVEGYDVRFISNPRIGREADVRISPPAVKRARQASLSVRWSKLFNCIQIGLRNISAGTVEQFKTGIDTRLATIPDEPTVPGRQRAAVTNSLLDQIALTHMFNYT